MTQWSTLQGFPPKHLAVEGSETLALRLNMLYKKLVKADAAEADPLRSLLQLHLRVEQDVLERLEVHHLGDSLLRDTLVLENLLPLLPLLGQTLVLLYGLLGALDSIELGCQEYIILNRVVINRIL